MFGGSSSPFGQSSSSPFGSQSPFGQNNVANNPFASQPFGSPNPFGSQTGASFFGSTSTGVFGQSSPLLSTPTLGATSSPGFGSSTPAFGSTSSSFGGSSAFGQKPAFGGFGTNTQTSPFGSSFQQSQAAFGSNSFGSTSPFGASSQPSFGATSSPAFGSSTTPAFGSSSTPTFGSTPTPTFGSTGSSFGVSSTPAFGAGGAFGSTSTPVFGAATAPSFGANTTPAFGATTTPAFGATTTPAFGASTTPAFGATTTPAFGATTSPAFGASTTPSFGTNSSPSFSFGSTPAFSQTASAFGSTPFGNTSSPFGTPSSPFGAQPATPTFGSGGFGQPTLGGQQGGSRVVPYSSTPEDGASSTQPTPKLESISAMAAYKDKSHEELRWEDYQRGDKGGPNTAGQSTPGLSFGATPAQSNPFSSSTTFSQMTSNPFSTNTTANPFNKTSGFGSTGFGTTTSAFGSSPFGGASMSSPFGSTSAPTSSLFATSSPAFGSSTTPSLFGTPNSSPLGSTSLFNSATTQGTAPSFGSTLSFGNTQSSPLFQSTMPSFGQTGSAFGQTTSSFGQTAGFSSSLFNPSSTGLGTNLFSSTPAFPASNFGQTSSSLSTPFQPTPPQTASAFNFSTFGQNQPAGTGGFGIGSGIFGQNLGQSSSSQNTAVAQPVAVTNPFGTLPTMPHMSIGNSGTSPSVQYGISSMPVVDKPTPVRISSLLTSRHLSQRRIRLPARKYHPKNDGSRVAFFTDEDEAPSTPKADALFIPRENPRALVIRPVEHWPSKSSTKEASVIVQENGKTSKGDDHLPNGSTAVKDNHVIENGAVKEREHPNKTSQKPGGSSDESMNHKGDSYITLSGHRAGEAAIVYEHGADIEAMMPKLRHSDYYTEPRIQELAAKERAEPGFCRNVKDFVVGRHGYGSIKFLGKTDVRRLDLESLVQFNNREVIVYMDDSKKPPIGQGLNKPAEVTLLNIKCYDKKTGNQILEGSRIEKYKEMLKKKAEDQGAEFLSYDPVKGEWKFRVSHFSKYMLSDELWDNDNVSAFC